MNFKLVIILVIGGILIIHELLTDGFMNALFLFGLVLAGFGLGRIAKERRDKNDDSDE